MVKHKPFIKCIKNVKKKNFEILRSEITFLMDLYMSRNEWNLEHSMFFNEKLKTHFLRRKLCDDTDVLPYIFFWTAFFSFFFFFFQVCESVVGVRFK